MNRFEKIILVLLGLAFATSAFAYYQAPDGLLKIYQLDVGQGDAMLLELSGGEQVLVDGGPDNKVAAQIDNFMPFYDRTIELVVLTHPDKDHISGLVEILKRYKVKTILETGIQCDKPECLAWEQAKAQEGAQVIYAQLGQAINLNKDIKLYVLHPFENLKGQKVSKPNNASIAARLIFGDFSLILTGDAEKIVEEKLLSQEIILDSDILKLGHHGSNTSSTEKFIQEISPQLAFISAGKDNTYGHPHKEVLDRLEKFGVKYYRTDTHGNIRVDSNGKSFQVKIKGE